MKPVGSPRSSPRAAVQDGVYKQVRQALMWGEFEPGKLITLQSLADTFGTSLMPVREALRRLAAETGLEVARGGSARVPAISRQRLDDLCQTRKALEGLAAECAAARMSGEEIEACRDIAREHERLGRNGEVYAMLRHNQAFHFAIYEKAGSDVLPPLIEMLWLRFGPYMRLLSDLVRAQMAEGSLPDYSTQHFALVDALSRRDGPAARAAMVADIEATQALLRGLCPA
ncbi:GntR family transcriptional regulator [Xaviernesmea oryzae]|uniref:GntR family transcriptional regulator n=1 Tax=Xaviernesmea oryzae TaxID=464029 RepID=A0A1Q9AQU5_9HYPH|nr:GntR family transcriptional regulator [Xaviernesmea oryzae]OLP57807.1 GntR family transcriptional regulator [Xaviernesmea oryzae]SEL36218.1 DNA-binding transcriptional regulator, GntR family [Xaviernesmea oryzae]